MSQLGGIAVIYSGDLIYGQIWEFNAHGRTAVKIVDFYQRKVIWGIGKVAGIIDRGHMVLKGTIDEIHRAAALSSPLLITVAEEGIDDTFAFLQDVPNVHKVTAQGNRLSVVFDGSREDETALLKRMVNEDIPIYAFSRQEGSLESLFMQIVGKNKKPAGRGRRS